MATCKECLHFEMCNRCDNQIVNHNSWKLAENVELICPHFKDKSKFIELPCKVGDTVYFVDYSIIVPTVVKCFETNDHGWCVRCDDSLLISTLIFRFDEFGKTVFLTTEEAEKAII